MLKPDKYYRELLESFVNNRLPPKKINELLDFIDKHPGVYEELSEDMALHEKIKERAGNADDKMTSASAERIRAELLNNTSLTTMPGDVVRLPSRGSIKKFYYLAAASVIAAFCIIALLVLLPSKEKNSVVMHQAQTIQQLASNDGAILILGTGRQISLDTVSNGKVEIQNGMSINLKDGMVTYPATEGMSEIDGTHTMRTPRGRQFRLQLPDGTNVWLNAMSSIEFPARFSGNERTVNITGELYFEVEKDKSKPFRVRSGELDIEVLGTHFNINSYPGSGIIKTTLLEGKVKVTGGGDQKTLTSGQQAMIAGEKLTVIDKANIDQVMAWKSGLFQFEGSNLATVMDDLARWYDLEVVYQGDISPRELHGKLSRTLPLSEVLKILAEIGIHSQLEGKRLIISQ